MGQHGVALRRWLVPVFLALVLVSAGCLSGLATDSPDANATDDEQPDGDAGADGSEPNTSGDLEPNASGDLESNASDGSVRDANSVDRSELPPVNTTASGLADESISESPLSPKPLPERPDVLTPNATEAYVAAYEEAHLWNTRVDGTTTNLTIDTEANARAEDGGYVVGVHVWYTHTIEGPSVASADYSAYYFVDEVELQRSYDFTRSESGPGLAAGTVLERWPENATAAS